MVLNVKRCRINCQIEFIALVPLDSLLMERVLCNRILFMSRNSLIDFIRALLIFLVILVHIVHFGDLHTNVKSMILAFMMPTF